VALWGEKPPPGPGMNPNGVMRTSPGMPNPGDANLNRPNPNDSAAPGEPTAGAAPAASADFAQYVQKDSENSYKINRQMLDEQLQDLTQLGMQARVIPNYRNGKYEGFKLVGVRPGSLYRAIGIRSGDIVRSINGKAINSPNKAMELFSEFKNAQNMTLEIERRGQIEKIDYTIQ
jgi:general secretion pathway protein C